MILLLDPDRAVIDRFVDMLSDTRWAQSFRAVSSLPDATNLLAGDEPTDVVLIGPNVAFAEALQLAGQAVGSPTAPPVILVREPTTEVLRAAMRAGVRDVVAPDFSAADLMTILAELGPSRPRSTLLPGLTVAVFATKGGVGTSMVASNLAVLLAQRSDAAVTLVDLDLASADQAIMHGIAPRWTVQDLVAGSLGEDSGSLAQVLEPIGKTGVRLLAGPTDLAISETISADDVTGIITAARREAPYVVLDTSSSFDDRTLAALDAADVVVIVSSLDVAALRGLSVTLSALPQIGIDDGDTYVVMVRSDTRTGLTVSHVERTLNRSIDFRVPSHRAVPRALNEGVPLAVSARRSSVVQAIGALADTLLARVDGQPVVAPVAVERPGPPKRRRKKAGGSPIVLAAGSEPAVAGRDASDGSVSADGRSTGAVDDGSPGTDLSQLPPPAQPNNHHVAEAPRRRRHTRRG